jgi:hypothetical protein
MTELNMELTRLAAKAAGIELEPGTTRIVGTMKTWRPLDDEGDALRLAIKLEFLVNIENCYYTNVCKEDVSVTEHIGNDGRGCIYAATRRAIVRAAAEIGKQIENL